MKKLTFKQAEKLHRELWGWLAETGSPFKSHWPGWEKHYAFANCFACQYVGRNDEDDVDCRVEDCPIPWSKKAATYDSPCLEVDSPFKKWEHGNNEKSRKHYAAIIRDLPWVKK